MGRKTVIGEEAFPEIVKMYNSEGKTAAYDYLRSSCGIKHPYFVINRIRESGKYTYHPDTDQFSVAGVSSADNVFMDLDELCGTAVAAADSKAGRADESRPAAMEKLIHELINDQLRALSPYSTMDSSTRTSLSDRTSLSADGYQVLTH